LTTRVLFLLGKDFALCPVGIVGGLSLEAEWLEYDANHSTPSKAEVRNLWRFNLYSLYIDSWHND
jgi:hypothetical protein